MNKLSVAELCANHGMNDIDPGFAEEDWTNITAFKAFSNRVKPVIQHANPKASTNKIIAMVAAKWAKFQVSEILALCPN